MATRKKARTKAVGSTTIRRPAKAARTRRPAARRVDPPRLFRLNVEVADLEAAERFYSKLLAIRGRRQPGSRVYFDCGPVTVVVLDMSGSWKPRPIPDSLYFVVRDLDGAHERARAIGCLSKDEVHGESGGEVAVRPWGERSFYAVDPWGNALCFVEAGTVYGAP